MCDEFWRHFLVPTMQVKNRSIVVLDGPTLDPRLAAIEGLNVLKRAAADDVVGGALYCCMCGSTVLFCVGMLAAGSSSAYATAALGGGLVGMAVVSLLDYLCTFLASSNAAKNK